MDNYVIQIIAALLAVFGVYCLVKVIAAFIFFPDGIYSALLIGSRDDAEALPELLGQTASAMFRMKRRRTLVIIPRALLLGEVGEDGELDLKYREIIEDFGAEYTVVDILPDSFARKSKKK